MQISDFNSRFLVRLLGAFLLWSLVGWLVFPSYARLVVPTTARVLAWIQPHDIAVELVHESPWVSWRFATEEHGKQFNRRSFGLLVYNTVLYLSLLTAVPRLALRTRLHMAATAAPAVFLFHVVDLSMTVESYLLTVLQRDHYDFLHNFGLWFSLVKFYNFFSIMALKQIIFVGLFGLQWWWLARADIPASAKNEKEPS